MDITTFKIRTRLFNMFGGKIKQKKANQKGKKKSKTHMDYTKIKLKNITIDTDSTNTQHQIIDAIESNNKSRDSECENEDTLTINDCAYSPISNDPIPLDINYSISTSPYLTSIVNIDNEKVNNSRQSEPEIEPESPSVSNSRSISPVYKYEYSYSDITTYGAISMQKVECNNLFGNDGDDELSQSMSYSDTDITPKMNASFHFDIDNIGPIGVIHSNEFIETNKFNQSRQLEIQNDLMDLIESDSDDNNNNNNDMTIIKLLNKFEIDSFVYYFNKVLNIEYINEMIDYEPNIIRRGLYEYYNNNIQIMLNMYKMFKYISDEIINGNLYGNKADKWSELYNSNCIYKIFGYKSNQLIDYKQIITNKNIDDSKQYENIELIGFDKQYVQQINTNKSYQIQIVIKQLPSAHQNELNLCHFGIENKSNNLYISDRLVLFKNNLYTESMNFGHNFIENGSTINIKINPKNEKYLWITISHKSGHKLILEETVPFELNHEHGDSPNIFIEQFNGNGKYTIYT